MCTSALHKAFALSRIVLKYTFPKLQIWKFWNLTERVSLQRVRERICKHINGSESAPTICVHTCLSSENPPQLRRLYYWRIVPEEEALVFIVSYTGMTNGWMLGDFVYSKVNFRISPIQMIFSVRGKRLNRDFFLKTSRNECAISLVLVLKAVMMLLILDK